MAENKFSVEFLATSLVDKLDRRNIFPPLLNNPELFVAPIGTRSKKPPNSFFICRKNVYREANRSGTHNMRVISKAASILWKAASHEEKSIYQKIASRVHEIYALRNSRPRLPVLPPIKPLKHSLSPPYPSFVTRPTTFNNIRIDIDYNRNKQKPYNPHSVYNVLNH